MSVKAEIQTALTEAMKSRDEVTKVPLRLVMAAIKEAEIEKQEELSDPEVLRIPQKEAKARLEAISDAEKAGRRNMNRQLMDDQEGNSPICNRPTTVCRHAAAASIQATLQGIPRPVASCRRSLAFRGQWRRSHPASFSRTRRGPVTPVRAVPARRASEGLLVGRRD